MKPARMLIGVGNPLGRDDGVGLYVARALESAAGWVAIPAGLALENALGLVERQRPDLLIVVDAADMGLPPGSVRRLPLEGARAMLASSHALPLEFALGIVKEAVGELVIVGVQPRDLRPGEGLTPEVEAGAKRLVALLLGGAWDQIPALRRGEAG